MSKATNSRGFSHLNNAGQANMVDVSDKASSVRTAVALATVLVGDEVLQKIVAGDLAKGDLAKGDLFATARIAGIQAAKRCAELIPLCHPLPLSQVAIEIEVVAPASLKVIARCKTTGPTGVEMEALTAASIAALTIYDMCKAIDKGIVITDVKLLEKTGGKSGNWSFRS